MLVKKIKYVLVASIIWIIPNVVHADCSYERMAELSRIAGNVNFSYEYEVSPDTNRASFVIDALNVINDIYIVDSKGNSIYNSGPIPKRFVTGETVTFNIYSNDNSCKGEKLLSKFVTLPTFNPYSQSDECLKYPEFKLCPMWMDTTKYPYEEFLKELNRYLKKENIALEEKNKGITFETILEFIRENKGVLITILIAVLVLIAAKIIQRKIVR